ncbi:hypothetical protein ACHAXN_003476 [Cyclotella atomus]
MNGKGSLLAKQSDNDEETNDSRKILGVLKKNPGTIIVVPFVALFGLDLIANIVVVTKRSLEVDAGSTSSGTMKGVGTDQRTIHNLADDGADSVAEDEADSVR